MAEMGGRPKVRTWAALYLVVQGTATSVWWILLLSRPDIRSFFGAAGAPDASLMALFLPDLCLFAGGAFIAAWALLKAKPWAWPALLVVTGASGYAALYSLSMAAFYQGSYPGAALMSPSLVVLPWLCWKCRP